MAGTNLQNATIFYEFLITEHNIQNVKLNTTLTYIKNLSLFSEFLHYKDFEKITNKVTETWLFYEIMVVLSHRLELSKIQGPLGDYLNNHLEFQLLQEENTSEEFRKVNIQNNRNKLTIRQFTKNYLEQKSENSIDEKRSPNNTYFGKISPFSSIQAKIDEQGEKLSNGKKPDTDNFLTTNHFGKAQKQELEKVKDDEDRETITQENIDLVNAELIS